ncbi:bacterial fructose-1,6-bisphosphatase, glpX-encoded-domain-containing protein [Scenedesmus sp. NREL 46B-D3]|nr:bacterial fructose-1,6-bisphosphatase, glpX-encoded-domain-containing protein [Scenedesmus sp. NREL 46B-D3]
MQLVNSSTGQCLQHRRDGMTAPRPFFYARTAYRSCKTRVLSPGKPVSEAAQTSTPPKQAAAPTGPDYTAPSRNLALELVRVTEAAALAAATWLGKGDKNAADQAAVDMMRKVLSNISMDGVVVIGEGEKDEAPMLYCGEHIGDGTPPMVDIAVDPLDGTTLTAQGRSGAIAVIALAERGCMYDPGPCFYMEKLAVGPAVDPRRVSLDYSVAHNLEAVANCLGKPVSDVTVLVLDRPRHAKLIADIRAAGARIRMISDGDVGGAIETAKPEAPVDVMMGIGGTPEGVIAAAALKCMGGSIQGRLWARNEQDAEAIRASGRDLTKILYTEDLVRGNDCFFAATGVSDGDLVRGVRFYSGGASTNSVVMRGKSQTVRYIETFHKWAGTAAHPSSPWHNQQMGSMGSPGMMSSSPGPSSAVFMMDD